MQCPICKKDLEIKNKKIGENEAGEAMNSQSAATVKSSGI